MRSLQMRTTPVKKFAFILALLSALLIPGCFFSECFQTAHTKKPAVVNRPTLYLIDKVGRITIAAHCLPGEQMIGGGYKLPEYHEVKIHVRSQEEIKEYTDWNIDPIPPEDYYTDDATEADRHQGPLSIEASYPSSLDTWTVIIFNGDFDNRGYHQGDLIQVDCYCVTNPRLNLRMAIHSLEPHSTFPEGGPNVGIIGTDNCTPPPMTNDPAAVVPKPVITAGGFKMEPLPSAGEGTGGYLAPLWGSYPRVDANRAIGWSTDYDTFAQHRVKLTTYVLYSRPSRRLIPVGIGPGAKVILGAWIPSPLTDGPVKIAELQKTSGAGPRPGDVVADEGYFSPGGGFRQMYFGEALVTVPPHGASRISGADPLVNGVRVPFAGWSVEPWGNYNPNIYFDPVTRTYKERSQPFTETDYVYAVQIRNLPKNIEVAITSPPDGSYIEEDPQHKGYAAVTLKGYAIDRNGNSITGSALAWKVSGTDSGTGEILSTSVNLSSGTYNNYYQARQYPVTLTATGAQGDHESASIVLFELSGTNVP